MNQGQQPSLQDIFEKLDTIKEDIRKDSEDQFAKQKLETNENFKNLTDKIEKFQIDFTEKVDNIQTEVDVLKKSLEEKNKIIETQEKWARKNNIIIYNLKEHKDEILKDLVPHFTKSKLQVELLESNIGDVFRLGKKNNTNRPVLVKLVNFHKKVEILKCKDKLKGTDWSIKSDYTELERKNRKELVGIVSNLVKKGIKASINKNQIVIDGNTIETEQAKELLNSSKADTPKRQLSPADQININKKYRSSSSGRISRLRKTSTTQSEISSVSTIVTNIKEAKNPENCN